jgi:hypothetical protein
MNLMADNFVTIGDLETVGSLEDNFKILVDDAAGGDTKAALVSILRQYLVAGVTPTVNSTTKTWYVGSTDTGVPATLIDDVNASASTTYSSNKIIDYIAIELAKIVNSSPEQLDTIKELADALGDDANFATTITNALGNKVDKVEGKGLSTNDYDVDSKAKVDKLITGGLGDKYLADDGTYKTVNASNIINTGDGTKFLSDDGTYKTVETSGGANIDDTTASTSTVYSSSKVDTLLTACTDEEITTMINTIFA